MALFSASNPPPLHREVQEPPRTQHQCATCCTISAGALQLPRKQGVYDVDVVLLRLASHGSQSQLLPEMHASTYTFRCCNAFLPSFSLCPESSRSLHMRLLFLDGYHRELGLLLPAVWREGNAKIL